MKTIGLIFEEKKPIKKQEQTEKPKTEPKATIKK